MGVKIKLKGVTLSGDPDPLRADPRLVKGSLALVDLTSSFIAAGVPASGATIHNVAWAEAAALIGSGDASTLACSWTNSFVAPYGAFERTERGALHGVVSLTDQGSKAARITGPSLLRAYLEANSTHDYSLIVWDDVTRIAGASANLRDVFIGNSAYAAGNSLFNLALDNYLGPRQMAVQKIGWSPNATSSLNLLEIFAWGNTSPYNDFSPNNGRSSVLYMVHLIDNTAGGHSHDDVVASHTDLYSKFFSSTGRYRDDTWSLDPDDYP